jgi:hypothetical protein
MPNRAALFTDLDQTQKRGQATEALLKAQFLMRDIPVLSPEYDNEPYDFVIEIDGEFHRIQAKTAYANTEGTVCFETVSTRARSDGYERDDYRGQIEFFAVFNPVLDESYLVPIEDAASGKMEIRYREPANNQWSGINWHEDYLLDRRLDELVN